MNLLRMQEQTLLPQLLAQLPAMQCSVEQIHWVWTGTHPPHIVAVCCLSSFVGFLPISLTREIACPDFVIYITALSSAFFYACSMHTRQAYARGGCASQRCLRGDALRND